VLVTQQDEDWLVEFARRSFGSIVSVVSRSLEQRRFVVQPQCCKFERTFGLLAWSRILSKQYERISKSSESNVYLASTQLMLQRLASAAT
jgi:hypothetical protein